ncbi:MAG: SMC-Scp complex subunit ScpB [Thermodesulfobacteriota bacterium]
MRDELKHIIESLLFVSEAPLSVDRIRDVLDLKDTGPVTEALDQLAAEYESRKGGFFLREVAGGFQIRTRPEYKDWIKRLLQSSPARLSKAALETLAIIAYKQPVLRSDIEYIRGVDSGGVLRMLLERKIIKVLGRKDIPGRPMIYGTTQQFLAMFDLKDLKDLPTPKEIESFGEAGGEGETFPVAESTRHLPVPAPAEAETEEPSDSDKEVGDEQAEIPGEETAPAESATSGSRESEHSQSDSLPEADTDEKKT